MKLSITLHKSFSKYPKTVKLIGEAEIKIEEKVNSEQFKLAVLNHKYQKRLQFSSTEMTNQEVYQVIMAGEEKLQPGKDEHWKVTIIPYWSLKRVVGYTYPNRREIWVNMRVYSKYGVSQIANNITHEQQHKLGFGHDFNSTPRRPYSVPYAVGRIVQSLIDQDRMKITFDPDQFEEKGELHRAYMKASRLVV